MSQTATVKRGNAPGGLTEALPKNLTCYTLTRIDAFNWSILEIKIKDGKVENWKRDTESTKEIKVAKIGQILATGRSFGNDE